MLDYLKEFFNDKKTYTIFIATLIVAMFVVIFFVWWPRNSVKEFARYDQVELTDKYKDIGTKYISDIVLKLGMGQLDDILYKVSDGYMKFYEKTEQQVKDEFFGKEIRGFGGITTRQYDNTVIYSSNISYKDGSDRTINIVESNPYNYEITFDDFYTYLELRQTKLAEGIEFNIQEMYAGNDFRSLKISIKNISNESVTFDINTTNQVYLQLKNNEKYYLRNVVVSDDLNNINSGKTVNTTLYFSIPFDVTSSIKYLIFQDVKIDGTTKDIQIGL